MTVHALHREGQTQLKITGMVGIRAVLVSRWLNAPTFLERRIRSDSRRIQPCSSEPRARMAAVIDANPLFCRPVSDASYAMGRIDRPKSRHRFCAPISKSDPNPAPMTLRFQLAPSSPKREASDLQRREQSTGSPEPPEAARCGRRSAPRKRRRFLVSTDCSESPH
jgi:hypothetical protein